MPNLKQSARSGTRICPNEPTTFPELLDFYNEYDDLAHHRR